LIRPGIFSSHGFDTLAQVADSGTFGIISTPSVHEILAVLLHLIGEHFNQSPPTDAPVGHRNASTYKGYDAPDI
jgi:hypothetical protein